MVTSILTVVLKVAELFLMIGVGVICVKTGMITRRGVSQLTSLLLYIVAPSLIVSSLATDESAISLDKLALSAGLAILAHVLGIVLSWLFFRHEPESRRRVFRFAMVYSNTGFMGMPLVQAVVGEEGVIYASIFIAVFNVFAWTHGYGLMSGGERSDIKKILLNPGIIGLVIGLPLFFLRCPLPELLAVPVDSFAALNTPLAMVVIGCNIARVPLRDFVSDKKIFWLSALRLILVPAVFFAVSILFQPEAVLLTTCVIQASAPVAANTVLFATQFGADDRLAARIVAVTTLLSIVTMPLFVLVAQAFTGTL